MTCVPDWIVEGRTVEVNDDSGAGSGTKTPINAVAAPAMNMIPPRTKYTMSLTHAKTLPDKIVPRQEETADRVTRGPKITMPIPTKKTTGRIGSKHSKTNRNSPPG